MEVGRCRGLAGHNGVSWQDLGPSLLVAVGEVTYRGLEAVDGVIETSSLFLRLI